MLWSPADADARGPLKRSAETIFLTRSATELRQMRFFAQVVDSRTAHRAAMSSQGSPRASWPIVEFGCEVARLIRKVVVGGDVVMGTQMVESLDAELAAAAGGGSGGGGGDLYADLYVVLRDLDPSDGGGDGEPVLDANGQQIPVGLNTATGETFPLQYVEIAEGDFEIPADQLPYLQEVALGRANVARAPDSVRQHALDEALNTIATGTVISTDAAGRIVVDGQAIDSPLENQALYHLIMTSGGSNSWTDVLAGAATNLPAPLANLLASGWNPTGLLGGAVSKGDPFSMDAMFYLHSILGVNEVTGSGETLNIDFFSFNDGSTATFDHDRVERYSDLWVQWYQDMDGDPFDLEQVQRTVLDAVWGSDGNGDGVNDVGSGVNWTDTYITLSPDGLGFTHFAASNAGVNDWAKAIDDSRAVINFLHEAIGGSEIPAPVLFYGTPGADTLIGGNADDKLFGLDGADLLVGQGGGDTLSGGAGNDRLIGDAGADQLNGGVGADSMVGGAGDDWYSVDDWACPA